MVEFSSLRPSGFRREEERSDEKGTISKVDAGVFDSFDVLCAEQTDRIYRTSANRRWESGLDRWHEARQRRADCGNVYRGRGRL